MIDSELVRRLKLAMFRMTYLRLKSLLKRSMSLIRSIDKEKDHLAKLKLNRRKKMASLKTIGAVKVRMVMV